MSPCEIKIQQFQELGILTHDFENQLTSEGFIAKTFLEFTEDLLVGRVLRIEDR